MREKHSPSVGRLPPLQSNLRGTRTLSPIEIIDAEHICGETDVREGLPLSIRSRFEEPLAVQQGRLNLDLVQGGSPPHTQCLIVRLTGQSPRPHEERG